MPRIVKCPICSETTPYTERNSLVLERKNARNMYFHKECHEKFLQHEAFKKAEREQLDVLVEVIKQIHGMLLIPSNFYPVLQDVRNGTEKVLDSKKYKYKKGATYLEIARAYELAKADIQYAKKAKTFKTDMSELRYCFYIVADRINQAINQLKREELQRTIQMMGDPYGDIGEDRPLPARKVAE